MLIIQNVFFWAREFSNIYASWLNNPNIMQNQHCQQLTPSYGCEHQTNESSKLSRASMTTEQRKMYESGMFFPERVIHTAKLDVKGKEEWMEDCLVKLTSQAFGPIPIAAITKIKYYRNEGQKMSLKISALDQDTFFLVRKEDVGKIFSLIAWGKLATMNIFANPEEKHEGSTQGAIFKKSYLLNTWDLRHGSITKEKGLQLAKGIEKSPSHTVSKTNEIWTRFDTIKNEALLVLKLWNGIKKEQYAVPAQSAVRWIQAFCSLLTES